MIAHLNAEIKKRVGQDRLIQLTNYDTTAVAIKEDTLDSASADAIGAFRYITGIEPEINNYTHVGVLIKGIQFYLESYKGRDNHILSVMEKFFVRDCMGIRERIYVSPLSNSNVEMDKEIEADKSKDFTRTGSIFPINKITKITGSKEVL